MFRRRWTGLPKDVTFPSDLKGLGYFVNDDDEIRSIKDPDSYFKFYINKNQRINQRQRFEFDHALQGIIHERLEAQGLQKIPLPLGTPASEPHVPVFTTPDLASKSRIVLIFGEPTQMLGLIAGRVANGPGGIEKGSMVSVVREIQKQACSKTDPSPPGIIIANPGEVYWWLEGSRSLTVSDSASIPLPSLVHSGRQYVKENIVSGHETSERHVEAVFSTLSAMMKSDTKISLVAIGQSCDLIMKFLDSEENWKAWQGNLDSMLLLGTVYPVDHLKNDRLRDFLEKRTRGYVRSIEPLDTPLSPPSGNHDEQIPAFGCPCYSSSEEFYTESIIIRAIKPALQYLQDVAMAPDYKNDEIVVAEKHRWEINDDDWGIIPDSEKPSIGAVDADIMKKQMRIEKRWKKFAKTGEALDTDSSDDEDDV